MATYGDLATIKVLLDIDAGDTVHDARLTALNEVASQEFADACGNGVSWGAAGADQAVTYTPVSLWPILVLSSPIRSVTTITINGDLVDPLDYDLCYPDKGGLYWGIETGAFYWSGEVIITGQWGWMPSGVDATDIPPDVTEAVNVIVAGYFRRDQTSEGQVSGPERFTFVPPNPWTDQRVLRAIDRYEIETEILF